MTRQRGVTVYPMPDEVCGPMDRYALVVRDDGQCRMLHTQGVSYLVTSDKPWCWTDYDPSQPKFSMRELIERVDPGTGVDMADWVRTFGARLESNFAQSYQWATS